MKTLHRLCFFAGVVLILSVGQPLFPAQASRQSFQQFAERILKALGAKRLVVLKVQNLSTASSSEFDQISQQWREELRTRGIQVTSDLSQGLPVTLTLSQNARRFLAVAEISSPEGRAVVIVPFERAVLSPPETGVRMRIERLQLWEQEKPILDLTVTENLLLVLEPDGLSQYIQAEGSWQFLRRAAISIQKPMPRDLRGRLTFGGDSFAAYLPGIFCRGTLTPSLAMACAEEDSPWPIWVAPQAQLLATLETQKNYFSGSVVSPQAGKSLWPPFYAAGRMDLQGKSIWLLAPGDGRIELYEDFPGQTVTPSQINPTDQKRDTSESWGDDFVTLRSQCGSQQQILISSAGDSRQPDSVRAYELVDEKAEAVSDPARFRGPVEVLWLHEAGNNALAVIRDLSTQRFVAFRLSVSCEGQEGEILERPLR